MKDNKDGTFDLFDIDKRKKWYRVLYLKAYWMIREIPWEIKKRYFKIQFFSKIWKASVCPWDMTDALPTILFEILKYYFDSGVSEDQIKAQYGCETEEESYNRYMKMFQAYSWYKVDRIIAQQKIDQAWDTHHETFPFEFRVRPTDETGEYWKFVDVDDDKATRKEKLKSSKSVFEMEDEYCKTQDKHLQNIIKHYRTLWD